MIIRRRKTDRHPHVKTLTTGLSVVAFDAMMAAVAMFLAVHLRYDMLGLSIEAHIDVRAAIVTALIAAFVWIVMRQDRLIWRFTSLSDFRRLFLGVIIVMAAVPLAMFIAPDRAAFFPRAAPFFAGLFFGLGIVLSRLIAMVIRNGDVRALYRAPSGYRHDAILVGQSSHLYNYLRDSARRDRGNGFNAVALLETSGQFAGRSIRSVPVLGTAFDLETVYPKLASRRDQPLHILSLDPNPDRRHAAHLIKIAAQLNAPLSRVGAKPGDGLSGFEATDLIGREPRHLDMAPVSELISGRRVLVTGAGGSIGSELSTQIARLAPSRLSLVDVSEYNLFELERKLAPIQPFGQAATWRTYLADVCNPGRMAEIFKAERPDIVLHAAALKHVPSGERNPIETLRTNVLGTQVTLDMCEVYGVSHFVLISTDKAVEPVNVMGASKRVVELLTMARQTQITGMKASAVRFGNVLGSTGSVVPLFEQQIAEGGPVTVTHADMNRFFMTVQEASALVLQAAALNAHQTKDQAGLYVLEMGEPVNIAQLARNLIRLRGKVPDEDIEIRYTGLRAGERLSEQLTHDEEMLTPTPVSGVSHFDTKIGDPAEVLRGVDALLYAIERRDREQIRKALTSLLKSYVPKDTLNGLAMTHDLPDPSEMSGLDAPETSSNEERL
jgi:O-antigen biosynthesis protein WbqV